MQPIIDNALHGLQLQEKQSYPKKENIGDRTMLHLQFAKPKIEYLKKSGTAQR